VKQTQKESTKTTSIYWEKRHYRPGIKLKTQQWAVSASFIELSLQFRRHPRFTWLWIAPSLACSSYRDGSILSVISSLRDFHRFSFISVCSEIQHFTYGNSYNQTWKPLQCRQPVQANMLHHGIRFKFHTHTAQFIIRRTYSLAMTSREIISILHASLKRWKCRYHKLFCPDIAQSVCMRHWCNLILIALKHSTHVIY